MPQTSGLYKCSDYFTNKRKTCKKYFQHNNYVLHLKLMATGTKKSDFGDLKISGETCKKYFQHNNCVPKGLATGTKKSDFRDLKISRETCKKYFQHIMYLKAWLLVQKKSDFGDLKISGETCKKYFQHNNYVPTLVKKWRMQ